MPDWSPAAPDTIGVGWRPGDNGTKTLTTGFQSLAWRFEADVTETVTEIVAPIDTTTGGLWIAEVYESGDEVAGTVTTQVFRPIGDAINTGLWYNQAFGTSNLYQSVDGTSYDPATYVSFGEPLPVPAGITFEFGTNIWPLGRRVTAIRLSMICACQDGSASFTGSADLAGSFYTFGGTGAVGTEPATLTFEIGEINPDTTLPWTAADIVTLSTTDSLGVASTVDMTSAVGFRIYQMWTEIDWAQEARVVVGVEELDASATGWATWGTLVNPNVNATTDWDKVDGTSYVVTLRNLGNADDIYAGSGGFPWLSDGEPLPTGWEQSYIPIDADGLITVPFDDFTTTRSTALVLTVTTPGDSADGQPWANIDGFIDQATEQQITTAVGGTYERLRFGWLDTTDIAGITPPAVDLTVEVKRQSDDVQFGSTETFTTAELQAGTLIGTGRADPDGVDLPAPLYLIERDFTSPPVLATTQYFVEFTGDGHAIAVCRPPDSTAATVNTYTNVNIDGPVGICEGPDGNLWFTSNESSQVGKITPAGTITMYTDAAFNQPIGICAGPDGNLWVTNFVADNICKVTTSGVVTAYTSGGNIDGPQGICAGPDGNLWTVNSVSNKVCKTTTAGVTTAYTDANFSGPIGICAGPDGNLWVTSYTNNKICKVTTSGTVTAYTDAAIDGPLGICSGPDGNLWATGYLGPAIYKITTGGTITAYSDPQIDLPYGITSDGTRLWFTSNGNDRIGYITVSGGVTTYSDPLIDGPDGIVWGPDDNPWFVNNTADSVGYLTVDSTIGAPATYHGATDAATIGALDVSADYPVTLSTVPDAPGSFAATTEDTELLTATDTACGVDSFDYVSITWTPTALGSSFGQYEIQRDNGDALGFQTIAEITDETVDEARDYESIRGAVSYRMRVCRSTDGICSDWTATDTVDRDAAGPAVWLFTSNAYPDLTCAYNVTDTQTYGWPDAPRQRVINHYGTDDKTRYVETERRLTAFDLALTVYSQSPTSDITDNLGVAPFYPLLELCSQTSFPGVSKTVTPYVAVIDPNGNSWYSAVTVDAGNVLVSQSNAHTTVAAIVQLTETPCPFDVEGGS